MTTQAVIAVSGGTDITVATGGVAAYWFPPNGFAEPTAVPNVTTTAAPFVDSVMPTHMTLDPAQHGWLVYVSGSSAVQLQNRIEALRDALLQFSFTLTTTRDGVARTWTCWPGQMAPADQGRDYEMQAAYLAKFTVSIPCDPIPGAP